MMNNRLLIVGNAALIVIITFAIYILSGMGHYTTDLEPGWMISPGSTHVTIVRSQKLTNIIYILMALQCILVASLVFHILKRSK